MLPKVQQPLYEVYLPYSKQKINIRPILVREEKILLLAKEANDYQHVVNAVKQVINNCVQETIDVGNLPFYEFLYLYCFLHVISVGATFELAVVDRYNEQITHKVWINLEKIKLEDKKINDKVLLDSDSGISIQLKVPTVDITTKYNDRSQQDNATAFTEFVYDCTVAIFNQSQVYYKDQFTKTEFIEFVDQLSTSHIQQIRLFFDSVPSIQIEESYVNSRDEKEQLKVDDLLGFFHTS